jgi:hypothetical protein
MKMTLLVLVALVLPACTTLDAQTEYDLTTDFSRYRTFSFADPADIGEERTPDEAVVRDRIEPVISETLKDKGLQLVRSDQQPDLAVYYWVNIQAKQKRAWHSGYSWGARHGGGRTAYPYREGTLVLDLVEPSKQELVWRATTVAPLEQTRKDNLDLAAKAIEQALAKYPSNTQTP